MPLRGAKELQARLAAVGKLPGRELSRQWADESVRLALANVRRRTGETARTIHVERVTDTGASISAAGAVKFLEGGVPPHPIEGRRGQSFKASRGRSAGRTIFVPRVRHPGYRPKRFWRNAYRKVFREQKKIQKVVDAWNRAA